jgi:hypothetical protein
MAAITACTAAGGSLGARNSTGHHAGQVILRIACANLAVHTVSHFEAAQ